MFRHVIPRASHELGIKTITHIINYYEYYESILILTCNNLKWAFGNKDNIYETQSVVQKITLLQYTTAPFCCPSLCISVSLINNSSILCDVQILHSYHEADAKWPWDIKRSVNRVDWMISIAYFTLALFKYPHQCSIYSYHSYHTLQLYPTWLYEQNMKLEKADLAINLPIMLIKIKAN